MVLRQTVRNISHQPRPDLTAINGLDLDGIVDGQGVEWDATGEALVPGGLNRLPENLTFSYNPDKTVSSIVGANVNTAFTYNGDKTVNTIDDQFKIQTFGYNVDKTVNTITVTDS